MHRDPETGLIVQDHAGESVPAAFIQSQEIARVVHANQRAPSWTDALFIDEFRESVAESNRKQMNRAGDNASKLATIEALCRRYNSPASEPGTHALAAKVIKIIEGTTP